MIRLSIIDQQITFILKYTELNKYDHNWVQLLQKLPISTEKYFKSDQLRVNTV